MEVKAAGAETASPFLRLLVVAPRPEDEHE